MKTGALSTDCFYFNSTLFEHLSRTTLLGKCDLKLFHFAGWLRLSRATTTGACEAILKHFKIV